MKWIKAEDIYLKMVAQSQEKWRQFCIALCVLGGFLHVSPPEL